MSLNIELLYVRQNKIDRVIDVIDDLCMDKASYPQSDWALPSSYFPLLANTPKRKIAISTPHGGWIMLVESKEVIDFGLAQEISTRLATTVLAVQISEATGSAGYAISIAGNIIESRFDEDASDPTRFISSVLEQLS